MSLFAILEAIRMTGELQVSQIQNQAIQQAREILANTRLSAHELADETRARTIAPAIKERARIMHHARLEAMQIIGNVRESLVDTALDQIRGRLAVIRAGNTYPAVLRDLCCEALVKLEGSLDDLEKVQLEADPRDKETLAAILADLEIDLKVSFTLNCWGGLIAKSQDGRVVVINTLEARLERAIPYLRRTLAAYFESESDPCPITTMAMHDYAP